VANALTVLLADDTPANQKIVKGVLAERGHRVTVVANGREAVDRVAQECFDAVLMDIQMPEMDGYQATAAIRKIEDATGKHTRIIALTAHSAPKDRDACLQAGMDAYVSKPIVVADLIAAVESPAKLSRQAAASLLEQEVMDLNGTMQRLGGDHALFERFVEVYNEDAPQLLEALRSAVPARDASATMRAAHSLRGLAANFGAAKVVELASQLETAGKEDDWQETDALLGELANAVAQLSGFLAEQERP
jgi:CheY-like chemotaxis protein